MKEFKKIPSLKLLYEISSDGVLRNVKSKKEIKPRLNRGGYYHITLYIKQERVDRTIHRLVAEVWVKNPNPDKFNIVNHKNEIKTDNRAENLEWCDDYYNQIYGTKIQRTALGKTKKIYSINKDGNIENFDSTYAAAQSIALEIKGNIHTIACHIRACCRNERKTSYKRKWYYKN